MGHCIECFLYVKEYGTHLDALFQDLPFISYSQQGWTSWSPG